MSNTSAAVCLVQASGIILIRHKWEEHVRLDGRHRRHTILTQTDCSCPKLFMVETCHERLLLQSIPRSNAVSLDIWLSAKWPTPYALRLMANSPVAQRHRIEPKKKILREPHTSHITQCLYAKPIDTRKRVQITPVGALHTRIVYRPQCPGFGGVRRCWTTIQEPISQIENMFCLFYY